MLLYTLVAIPFWAFGAKIYHFYGFGFGEFDFFSEKLYCFVLVLELFQLVPCS